MKIVIVGTTSLALQCAQFLLETQHRIHAVCTDDLDFIVWCQQHDIRYCHTLQELLVISKDFSTDVLLSIVNPFLLSREILQIPSLFAINYHDSSLPRYAGVHATSWAIFRGEKFHGISWHVMEEGLDTGDLLVQRTFPIDPNETAVSLNIKCYETAIESFQTLLKLLVTKSYKRTPQELGLRTYYGYDKTIPHAGIVQWTESAEYLQRLARAADLGHYENTWGLLKFYLPDQWIYAVVLESVTPASCDAPGTLIAVTETYWEISTATEALRIGQFVGLDGQSITPLELASRLNLSAGCSLPRPPLNQAFLERYSRCLMKEKFWLPRLIAANAMAVTGLHHSSARDERDFLRHVDSLPTAVWDALPADADSQQTQRLAALMVSLFIYFFRTGWFTGETLGYTPQQMDSSSGLLLRALPVRFEWNATDSFSSALAAMSEQLSTCVAQGPILTEMFLRYPALVPQQAQSLLSPAVVVVRVRSFAAAEVLAPTALMTLAVDEGDQFCLILSSSIVSSSAALAAVAQRLKHLLTSALQQQETPLGSLPLMTPVESQHWLQAHRQVEYLPASFNSLVAVFFEQAQLHSQQPAVYEQEQKTTYDELAQKVRQLRHYLTESGLTAEQPVLIVMDRSLDFIVAILATLLGGQHYVPIHPETPTKRLQKILLDCKAQWVLTHSHHLECLGLDDSHHRVQRIALDQIQERLNRIERQSSPLKLPAVSGDGLACIHYTSGSTGSPKGVRITHQAIFRLFHQQDFVRITSQDCMAHLANVMFDAVTFEIWGALLHGAAIEIFNQTHLLNETQFASLFKKRVTVSFMTVSFFNHLIQFDLSLFKALKAILFGGEINQPKLINKLIHYKKQHQLINLNIINSYGPTECTTFATFYKVEDYFNPHWLSFPIGKPLRYTQAWVLDAQRQPLPPESYGELYLSGLGLGGYVETNLNAAVFFHNPFDQAVGYDRLYKTGDRVRWHEDGNLEMIDRVDQQVKLRGFRIELTEIEQVLGQYPDIELCKVLLQCGAADQKRLVAYYQGKEEIPVEELTQFLSEQLPAYMVPHAFCALTRFPLTANGKIDLQALPQPQLDKRKSPGVSTEVLSPLESRLQQLWQTLLKIEPIGLHEDYFALGGDSILAMQLVAQAAHQGIQMTAAQLFQHPTVAALAQVVKEKQTLVSPQEELKEEVIPLLPIQQWFFSQSLAQPAQFIQYVSLDLKPTVSVECLRGVLQTLWQHSPLLHAVFFAQEGQWQQQIAASPSDTFELPLMTVSEEDTLEAVIQQVVEERMAAIRLAQGNLFHGCVLCNGQQQPLKLLLLAHHLVIDGVSWRVLVDDLNVLIHQYEQQQALQLPTSTSIAAWSRQLQRYAQSLTWEDLKCWHTLPSQQSLFPFEALTPKEHREKEARTQRKTLTTKDTHTLLQSLQSTPVSLQEVLLTALVQTLSQWLQTSTVALTLEGHGREALFANLDVSRTIGWFTTVFPVVFELPSTTSQDNEPLLPLLKRIRETVQALPDRGLPYGVAYYETSWHERLKLPTLPAISFNFLGHFTRESAQAICFDDRGVVFCSHPENVRAHSLEVTVWVVEQRLQMSWRYPQKAWQEDFIAEWMTHFAEAIRQVGTLLRSQPTACFVPADFKLLSLTEEELDRIEQRVTDFQALWPLSPLQQGLLMESLRSPNAGFYHSQVSWHVHGRLNRRAFEYAWNQLLATQAALRVSFLWDVASQPIQVVSRRVVLSCEWVEFSGSSSQQAQQWQRYREQQRHLSFDWSTAPLMRVMVVKFNAEHYGVIWTHHHILLDGWSIALLLQQLDHDYQQYQKKPTFVSLRPGPSYQHYLQRVTTAPSSTDQVFWRGYLAGCTVTDLPMRRHSSDNSNPTVLTYDHPLSPSLSQQLRTFAQQRRLTLNTLFHFACAFLVSRYTNTTEVLIGFTVAQRDLELPGISQQVGLLINTLPYRLRLCPQKSVAEHLQQAQRNIRELTEHGTIALTELYHLTEKTPDHLFDLLFVFENYPSLPAHFEQVEISESTHYPLVLTVHPHEEMTLRFHYQSSALTLQQVERFCDYYQQLLQNLIDQVDQPITALTPYGTADRQRLLSQWQSPVLEGQGTTATSSLWQRWLATSQRDAQKTALISAHSTLTYAALASKVQQWASVLQQQGVSVGTRVGVYLGQGEAVVIAFLALIQLQAVFVPLDPAHPSQRSRFMIEDAELTVMVTDAEGYHKLTESVEFREPGPLAVTVLDLPRLSQDVPVDGSLRELCSQVRAEDPILYILYTSGSTGKPKGVIVREQGVVNVLDAVIARLGASEDDRLLSLTSPSFDLFIFEILGPLTVGMTLVVSDPSLARDAPRWQQWIKTYRPTLMQSTPSGFELLLYSSVLTELHGMQLLSCGEPLTAALAQRLIAAGARLWNLYGATEATIHSTMILINKKEHTIPPIGPPIANTQLYLLDHWGHPTPEEGIGELSIAGLGLAAGYLNQPQLTRSRFVWRSLLPESSAVRLYQTGDLAQQQGDGLVFKGRCDDQVKIQGLRVELDEIRTTLNRHSAVAQSVVIWLSSPDTEQRRLVAFYVPRPSNQVSVAELRHFLSQQLPTAMVPHDFVEVAQFPLTVSGKVNKTQLTQQYLSTQQQKAVVSLAHADSLIEQQLLEIFRSTLKDPNLQPEDHFFARGGYSLLALQVLAEIKRLFKAEITVSMFSQSSTVTQLAALIEHSAVEAPPQSLQSALIPLKSGSRAFPPLFLIHPIGGTVFWFVSLAQYMQYPGSLYAIQDPGLLSKRIPFQSLEALAAAYLELVHSVTSEVVLLGGASFGANVATEMASQVQAAGQFAPYVALLDGWAFYPEVTRTRQFLQELMQRQFADTKARFDLSPEKLVAPYLDLHWHRAHLLANYRLKPLSFPLTLFKAQQTAKVLQSIESPSNHWDDYCQQVSILHVPGDHETMFYPPAVKTLAQQLDSSLSEYLKKGQRGTIKRRRTIK